MEYSKEERDAIFNNLRNSCSLIKELKGYGRTVSSVVPDFDKNMTELMQKFNMYYKDYLYNTLTKEEMDSFSDQLTFYKTEFDKIKESVEKKEEEPASEEVTEEPLAEEKKEEKTEKKIEEKVESISVVAEDKKEECNALVQKLGKILGVEPFPGIEKVNPNDIQYQLEDNEIDEFLETVKKINELKEEYKKTFIQKLGKILGVEPFFGIEKVNPNDIQYQLDENEIDEFLETVEQLKKVTKANIISEPAKKKEEPVKSDPVVESEPEKKEVSEETKKDTKKILEGAKDLTSKAGDRIKELSEEKKETSEKKIENPFDARPVNDKKDDVIVEEAAASAVISDIRVRRCRKFSIKQIPAKILEGVKYIAGKIRDRVSNNIQPEPIITNMEKFDYELHEMQRKEAFEQQSRRSRLQVLKDLRSKLLQRKKEQDEDLENKTSKSFGHVDLIYLSILLMLLIFIIGVMTSK